jgi:hypothetical protein
MNAPAPPSNRHLSAAERAPHFGGLLFAETAVTLAPGYSVEAAAAPILRAEGVAERTNAAVFARGKPCFPRGPPSSRRLCAWRSYGCARAKLGSAGEAASLASGERPGSRLRLTNRFWQLFSCAEGWQSGRMRRSRKPLSVVRRIEGSNPSPSAALGREERRRPRCRRRGTCGTHCRRSSGARLRPRALVAGRRRSRPGPARLRRERRSRSRSRAPCPGSGRARLGRPPTRAGPRTARHRRAADRVQQ